MISIALPTAEKQNAILKNTQSILQKMGLMYPSNAQTTVANATGVDSSNYTTLLEITGHGFLHEAFTNSSDGFLMGTAVPNGLRITIDGVVVADLKSDYAGCILANRKINLINLYDVGSAKKTTYTVWTTQNLALPFRGFHLVEDSIEFKNSLKIEHFAANRGKSYATYTID